MTSLFARARRALGRWLCGADGPASISTVPVTVRAHTADGADLRLLLEVRVEHPTISPEDLERIVHALTVPAASRCFAAYDLGDLQTGLEPAVEAVTSVVASGLSEVGQCLLAVDMVAAEHLLASPSADPVHGSR